MKGIHIDHINNRANNDVRVLKKKGETLNKFILVIQSLSILKHSHYSHSYKKSSSLL